MVVEGAGAPVTLFGDNTFSGGVSVKSGLLMAMGSTGSSTGSGDVTIAAGAGLGGSGTIAGNVAVAGGGRIAPGYEGTGSLKIARDLTWDGTPDGSSSASCVLGAADDTCTHLAIGGAFTKGAAGRFQFDFHNSGRFGTTYVLATFTSTTFVAGDFTFVGLALELSGSFDVSETALAFTTLARVVTGGNQIEA